MKSFQYDCSRGHFVTAPRALSACPACLRGGKPCDGTLKRVGEGSRSTKEEAR